MDSNKQSRRFQQFAAFFQSYMSVATMIVAVLPIPVAQLNLIPVYGSLKGFLSVYTSLFCFLILGYIFYTRHWIAFVIFGRQKKFLKIISTLLPLLLIFFSLASILLYHEVLDSSIRKILFEPSSDFLSVENGEILLSDNGLKCLSHSNLLSTNSIALRQLNSKYLLENLSFNCIPDNIYLILLYLNVFISAESAFILMALREYLQDVLQVSDVELIKKYLKSQRDENSAFHK
ncbi:MAG: hypothetical protein AB4206_17540 [Xenococcaceae cyanobacterium]